MKKYTRYKFLAIIVTSFFIVSYELVRHYILIDYLQKDIDILFSSLLFIVVSIIISHRIFHALEKLELQTYQKEIEAKAMFDNSVDGIFVFHSNGKILDMNQGAKRLSGWGLEDARSFEMLFHTSLSFDQYHKRRESEAPRIWESYVKRKDGKEVPVSLTLSYLKDLPGHQDKMAVIARDLSERKQMENVIKDLYAEATQKHYETEILYQISRKMATIRELSNYDAQAILRTVSYKIQKLLKVAEVAILIRPPDEDGYSLAASTQSFNLPEGKFFEKKQWEDFEFKEDQLIIPFQSNDENLGFIVAGGADKVRSSMNQQEVVKSIKQIFSITIENSQLYQKLKGVTILEERERLAREMHDGLAQDIGSISMKLQVLKSLIHSHKGKNIDSMKLQTLADDLEKITNEAYHEIRHHLFNLRTPFRMNQPFDESLANYADIFERQTGIRVKLIVSHSLSDHHLQLSQHGKVHVIRIIQEALSNVTKHANATEVTLEASQLMSGGLEITIKDNGNGFKYEGAEPSQGHYGLEIMKERAELFEGDLRIDTIRGKGTKITLTIPLERRA
ncbi:PAS domain S-box protein [Halobacillus sp. GSS1]|uniref:PAS domain S-box protein n=1 Tax=Halobacillus sp. GSS1 TaxID=2815919 RepID=UPI001A8CF97E|nr:PAS domain S-box protein [Halobacillus sp. GSS1]MBN9654730.1 PAS domain S-box protein [Halobacillus sp. GSS1]